MALVLAALMLAALCGVHSASIPSSLYSNLDKKLDDKSVIMQDKQSLNKTRRSVLEDMKRLLDSQLEALFEGEGRAGDKDTGGEALRDAVNELLLHNEDNTTQLIDNDEAFDNKIGDQLNDIVKQNNDEEIINEDINDNVTSPPTSASNEDRRKGKSNHKKGISHVIIEHVPKINKNNDNFEKLENVLDLDEILKTMITDSSGPLSQEDWNNESSFGTDNLNPISSKKTKTHTFNISQAENTVNDHKDNDVKVYKASNINKDGKESEKEKPRTDYQNVSRYNDKSEIHLKSGNQHIDIISHPKLHHDSGRYYKAHQRIFFDNNVKKRIGHDKKDTIKQKNKTNEEGYHNSKQYLDESSKQRSGSRSKPHDNTNTDFKHNKNLNNVKEDNHHIIVRLISDSDGSNESGFDVIQNNKNANKNTRSGLMESNDSSTSKENAPSEVTLSQEKESFNKDKENLLKIKESNSNDKEMSDRSSNIAKDNNYNSKEENDLISRINVAHQNTNQNDDAKRIDVTPDIRRKYEDDNNINNNENILFIDRQNPSSDENDITNNNKNETGNKNNKSRTTEAAEIKDTSEAKDNLTKEKKYPARDGTMFKKENRQGIKQYNIIRDIFENKDLKKSYSLSLTLSAKE